MSSEQAVSIHIQDVPAAVGAPVPEEASVSLRPNRRVRLHVTFSGRTEQHIYLRGYSPAPGLVFEVQPREALLPPGQTVSAELIVRKAAPFWLGGRFPARVMAMTAEGLFGQTPLLVRVRPRYELLLLLLLLGPIGMVAAALLPPMPQVAALPTATVIAALPTDAPIPTVTFTFTPLPTATFTPEATRTPSPSFTPIPQCVNQCGALGWPSYIVQPGDTLSRLAQAAGVSVARAAQVNCIGNANVLPAGAAICLPRLPVIVTAPPPAPTCAGFRATSPFAFPQGVADFYWDAPSGFAPTSYRLEVYNADNGALLASRDVPGGITTAQLDVSSSAIGGAFSLFWRIHALVNGAVVCSDQWNVLRERRDEPDIRPPVTVPPPGPVGPDLVSAISVVGRPTWSNDSCYFLEVPTQVTVRNIGNRPAGTFATNIFYSGINSDGPESYCGYGEGGTGCPVTALEAGASRSFNLTVYLYDYQLDDIERFTLTSRADVAGGGYLADLPCADPVYCNVNETNETNNSASVTVDVPPCLSGPDVGVFAAPFGSGF